MPTDLQFFVEVRHTEWFGNNDIRNEFYAFLKDNNIGIVITDTSGRTDCANMHLTIAKTFI